MSNAQWQGRAPERKRDVVQRPFQQGRLWIGRRLDRFRSRLPHSSHPSIPQTTVLPETASSQSRAVHRLDVPDPPNEYSIYLEPLAQEYPQPDALAQERIPVVPPNGLTISSNTPAKGTESLPSSQAPEVATSPSKNDIQNDNPPSLRESSAAQARDKSLPNHAPYSPSQPLSHKIFDYQTSQAVTDGSVSNINAAGNVFSGVNYGSVTMKLDDDFAVCPF
ncbi:hypothetical protein BKA70DRAFT_1318050 [Coprinopsis sp. MPI-PUGE-AT-0042]|nr:hypothetical protein BKA70DRAFT_1318050 [Coprinopsis sp. MPI-PUGE-AT-0042]